MQYINIRMKSDTEALNIKIDNSNIEWYYNSKSNSFDNTDLECHKNITDKQVLTYVMKQYNDLQKELMASEYSTESIGNDREITIADGDVKYFNIDKNPTAFNLAKAIVPVVNVAAYQVEEKPQSESDISKRLLEFASSSEYKKQEIDFVWKTKSNLRYVSDESLELILFFLKRAVYRLEQKEDKILLHNNIKTFCENKTTTDDLIKNASKYLLTTSTTYTIPPKSTVDFMCINCNYQRCPKQLLAFIHYAVCTGTLEDLLKDRQEHLYADKIYTFDWNYEEILKYIPENLFNFSNQLVEKNIVCLGKSLKEGEWLEIRTLNACGDFKVNGLNIEEYNPQTTDFSKAIAIKRDPKKFLIACANETCGLKGCPLIIAALIKYLKDLGREQEIITQREYYKNNIEECEKHYYNLYSRKAKSISLKNKEYIENLKEVKSKNLGSLISILEKGKLNSLFITIEGKDKNEKRLVINNIHQILLNLEKIKNRTARSISLFNLAASSAFPASTKESKEKDLNLIPYNSFEQIYTTIFKPNNLYVVTGITEFLNDYKKVMSSNVIGSYQNIRAKQFANVLENLCNFDSNNYIILDATEEEINNLIEINPKLQFIYQNNRFVIDDYPIENTYEIFMKKLNNNLFNILKEDKEKYKKMYIDYVSLNKPFIPFDNREIASYLAMYCNMEEALKFPEDIYKKETIDEALKNIIGLNQVKEHVKKFEQYMLFKLTANANNLKLSDTNMHMIFTGNPGTGKTTIARIVAKMLYDMGVIKENKLVEVERKDLVAEYIGQTATKTSQVIEKAMGGVLFVDEAYTLASKSGNDFGSEAIATLIKAMEDHKGDFVVIFAGYKKEMYDFLEINPGINSRIGYKFDFPDYTSDELLQIFYRKTSNMGFEIDKACDIKLLEIFECFSRKKSFGNGRFVDKIIQETLLKHAINPNSNLKLISTEDIPTINELNNTNDNVTTTEELLENIIGLEKLKEKIKEFEEYVSFISNARKQNINIPMQNMHMIFTGNPGTGKTTVARIMTKILYNVGIIHDNTLLEVERKDLVAEYVGQTAAKTSQVIERAMGGVLFVDEAYSLASKSGNDFGSEAIATLIKAMEDHKGDFVVIFAGYKKEMAEFMEINSGIASRIGYTFEFEDYTREELTKMLCLKLEKSSFRIDENAKPGIETIMNYFARVDNIGNGRFVDRIFNLIIMKHAKNKSAVLDLITNDDIPSIKEVTESLFNGDNMINPDNISNESLRKTAIHEIGHAYVRYKLFASPDIIKITINSEGTGALGYVQHKVDNSSYVQTKSTLLKNIKTLLAGMASEEIFLGEFANGNTSDLEKATTIAHNMITKFGMSKLGFGKIYKETGELSVLIQKEINDILNECYEDVKKIITDNKETMTKAVDYLYDKKEIDEEEFLKIINNNF